MGEIACLVVEDHVALAHALRVGLTREGVAVVEVVHTVAGALAAASATSFNLCLLDFQLPDGTALDLIPVLCSLDVVVWVMTAEAGSATARVCLEAGAWAFTRKPVTWQQVGAAVTYTSSLVSRTEPLA